MAEIVALSKILNVREKEKHDAQKSYQHAIDRFEGVATKLYALLKKKEDAESTREGYIQHTIAIEKIREQLSYIEMLNKQILHLQQEVQTARSEMESKQLILTDAHVEVKKFEKIISYRKEELAAIVEKNEKIFMDEISVQQYINQKK